MGKGSIVNNQKRDRTLQHIAAKSLISYCLEDWISCFLKYEVTQTMRFDWDNDKSQLLQENRGYSLDEVSVVLAGKYVEQIKRDDPEQFIAIGYLEKTLLSIIYEIRYDKEGEYIWLITYWNSTKREREIYEQYLN
jgi:uncharacterized DUF497 family protein